MGRRGRGRGPYRVGDDEATVSPRARAELDQLRRLEGDGRVYAAALVASTFGLDPVAVLAETSTLNRLIRLAAHNRLQNEAKKHASS